MRSTRSFGIQVLLLGSISATAYAGGACLFNDGGLLGEDTGARLSQLICTPEQQDPEHSQLELKGGKKSEFLKVSSAECGAILRHFNGNQRPDTQKAGIKVVDMQKVKSRDSQIPYIVVKKGTFSDSLKLGSFSSSASLSCAATARDTESEISVESFTQALADAAKKSAQEESQTASPGRILPGRKPKTTAEASQKEKSGLINGVIDFLRPAAEDRGWTDEGEAGK